MTTAAPEQLSSTRWQVLARSPVGRRGDDSRIARRTDLTAKVHATVKDLLGDGLVELARNPDHRRSPSRAYRQGQAKDAAMDAVRSAASIAPGTVAPAALATAECGPRARRSNRRWSEHDHDARTSAGDVLLQPVCRCRALHQSGGASARMACGVQLAATEFSPSYRRATVMQASLAVFGFLFAALAWVGGASGWWLAGGITLLAVAPFTLVVMMSTNRQLMDPTLDRTSDRCREAPCTVGTAACRACRAQSDCPAAVSVPAGGGGVREATVTVPAAATRSRPRRSTTPCQSDGRNLT